MPNMIVYNGSLLHTIKRLNGCTIEELKAEYLPPEQPGVIQGIKVTFESDLQDLEHYGAIEKKDNKYYYICEPRSLI